MEGSAAIRENPYYALSKLILNRYLPGKGANVESPQNSRSFRRFPGVSNGQGLGYFNYNTNPRFLV